MAVFGIGFAFILIELVLRARPNLVPSPVRVNPPVRRVQPFVNETYDVLQSQGDLFYWERGSIQPLLPAQDEILASVHLTTDEYGFRNPSPVKDRYAVVALGDSFTDARNVAVPWPQQLAIYSGLTVLNLGETAFGPQEELGVLREYGLDKHPQWVVMAYFEANDLYDAVAYAEANPFILPRLAKYLVSQSVQWVVEEYPDGATAYTDAKSISTDSIYRYPVSLTVNGNTLEMAFFSAYLSWLSVSREDIQSSRNFELVAETILETRDITEESGAQFLLVYLPSKARIYLPHVDNPALYERILDGVSMVGLGSSSNLDFMPDPATSEMVGQNMDAQARLVAEFAAEQGISFLDLSPVFRAEAERGEALYYPFDTHWSQLGHDLAAKSIAEYLESQQSGPSN